MGKKVIRDPNAPKRNLSAYLLYQNAMRETFKSEHPHLTFGQLSKHTSVMYSNLNQEEKAEWQMKADQDKIRYLSEMSKYEPPAGYDARGEAVINHTGSRASMAVNYAMQPSMMVYGGPNQPTARSSKRIKCRDPHAPKRNLSPYLLYQNAMRDQFKNDNPGMTFGQLSKYTSHMYKNLTAQEKTEWESRAIDDKARFEEEMRHYVPPPGFDANGILIDTHPASRITAAVTKKVKKPRDPNAPKRARGSYVFFTNYIRPIIMKERPNTKFVELGSMMGERWRSLSADERKKYEELANEDRDRFNRETEEYNAKKAEAEAATSVNNYSMPQIMTMDQNQLHYANHVHYQMPPPSPPPQQVLHEEDSTSAISMESEQQHHHHHHHHHQHHQPMPQHHQQHQQQHSYQNYLPLETSSVYSNNHYDSGHYPPPPPTSQYSHPSHNV